MNAQATQIIRALGGSSAAARLFGIAVPSVTKWKKSGIPRPRMMFLELARPDLLVDIDINAATSKAEAPAVQDVAHA
ncbi:hypothetical protein AVHY2522_24655 [Acidovorax sp. SUPP2522]|uniref:hypothetical protein n=1 Tax=unclassified Acidovorax TaxID=2684926 RepID=UPI00234BB591|nr:MULTISPECIES: hypothetical protein [unclassified Acidovorax]WCM96254.1 Cro/CI family transcriptional regulator [Acidovorax sp. GBBC 1281]GKT20052.1 hypothetical protein AVHY2522_24655 [Acidovorax sp. SUPP2522]